MPPLGSNVTLPYGNDFDWPTSQQQPISQNNLAEGHFLL
jgi:hypothetical protein